MTLAELRSEHESVRIGARWLEVVRQVCQSVTHTYSPQIYGQVERWIDGIDDLVQDVVVNALIRDHQAEYLIAESATMVEFRRLLAVQVRHVLARRRRRTVVDQLLDRSSRLLRREPFVEVEGEPRRRFTLAGKAVLERSPTPVELRAVALAARALPRVRSRGMERAPVVYREEVLVRLLLMAAERLPTPFGISALDQVFRELLTDYLPGVLDPNGWSENHPGGRPSERPEEALDVIETTDRLLDSLGTEGRQIVAAKLAGVSDSDLARGLGVSRPTAASRKEAVLATFRLEAESLAESLLPMLIEQLALRLAGEWPAPQEESASQ
jgi:hypothetical protein